MNKTARNFLLGAPGASWYFITAAFLTAIQTACVIGFSWGITQAIVEIILPGRPVLNLVTYLGIAAICVTVRAIASWAWTQLSAVVASRLKLQWRSIFLNSLDGIAVPQREHLLKLWPSHRINTFLTSGLDSLDNYFGKYLPQVLATLLTTPLLVISVWFLDPLSALILVVVVPLLPILLALIGMATGAIQRQQWHTLNTLSGAFLEILGGLTTLKLFSRSKRQVDRISRVTNEYRLATMKVLRVTFLSGFVLDFGASLSIALVAVAVGLRLVSGDLTLVTGLFVLLIVPEIFLPIRNVGSAYHTSTTAREVSADAAELYKELGYPDNAIKGIAPLGGNTLLLSDTPLGSNIPLWVDPEPSVGSVANKQDSDSSPGPVLHLKKFVVNRKCNIGPVDLKIFPGEVVTLTGSSGAGKSSIFAGLLGLAPTTGDATIGRYANGEWAEYTNRNSDLRRHIAWASQNPLLLTGSVADNIRLGSETAPGELIDQAAKIAELDFALDTRVYEAGSGLSRGQAQRVALARAIHRVVAQSCPLLLLDEPTSALDLKTAHRVIANLGDFAQETGVAIFIATHSREVVSAVSLNFHLADVSNRVKIDGLVNRI